MRQGDATVEVLPREVRRLVYALVEATGELVGGDPRGGARMRSTSLSLVRWLLVSWV